VRQVKWFSSEQAGVTEILFWAFIKVCYTSLYFLNLNRSIFDISVSTKYTIRK
jgi:hypothetical protein